MLRYKNLIIIGTSHIAIESIKEVEATLLKIKPNIIALELDKLRFNALVSGQRRARLRDITDIGLNGYFFNLIGAWVEKRLGKIVNVKPGSEMKKAIEISKQINAKICLIDQDIRITLKRISKRLTWKEKFTFLSDIIKGIFTKQRIKIDFTKVPDKGLIKKLTKDLKERYPTLYNILIKDRNEILAKNLKKIISDDKQVVVILGAGHEDDVLALIKNDYK